MRTKEFIKRVEELGFEVVDGFFAIHVSTNGINSVANVNKEKEFSLQTCTGVFKELKKEKRKQLLELCVEYASTPIEDREEEKRFLVQHKFLVSVGSNPVNLVKYKNKNNYRVIRCLLDNQFYQARFTLKEVEEIKKKFDTDLKDFELVEVEE